LWFALSAAGAETPVADLIHAGAMGDDTAEVIASDGSDYLVIWKGPSVYGLRYAARVTRTGEVGDRVLIPLGQPVEYLVWTGNSYLAVWTHQEIGGRYSIVGMRLDRDGNVILGKSGSSTTLVNEAFPMACVSNGKNVVVAYTEYSYTIGTRRPRALVLSSDAVPVANLLLADSDWRMAYDVAWNGNHFAAAWIDGKGPDGKYDDRKHLVLAVRFTPEGVIDTTPRTLFEEIGSPAQLVRVWIQSDGKDFLVLNRADGRTLGRRVSGDLQSVGASHVLPEDLDRAREIAPLFVAPDYVVILHTLGSNLALHLDREGAATRTDPLEKTPGSTNIETTIATTNGEDLAFAWSGYSPGSGCADPDLFVTAISTSTRQIRFQQRVSLGPRDQRTAMVAAGNANALVAWVSNASVYARRFSHDGVPIDVAPLLLAECSSLLDIEFNGHDYFVIVSRSGGFDVVNVAQDGTLRAVRGASVSGAIVGMATNAGGTAIVWGSSEGRFISRLSVGGQLLETAPLGTLISSARSVAFAAGESDFMLAWDEPGAQLYCTEPVFGSPPMPGICYTSNFVRGARIAGDLTLRDPSGFDIASSSSFEYDPAISWNGERWLVAWYSAGTPRTATGPRFPDEIRGRFISREGLLDEHAGGVRIVSDASAPELDWDGARWLIRWQAHDSPFTSTRRDRFAWLQTLDYPLASVREVIAYDHRLSLAVTGPGTALMSYSKVMEDLANPGFLRGFVNAVEAGVPRRRTAR
jgi:hypothetical protein